MMQETREKVMREVILPDVPTLPAEVAERWGERSASIALGLAEPPPLDITLKDPAQTEIWKTKLAADSILLRSSLIDVEKNPGIMLAKSPEREREIEAFQNLIRACAAAGVPMLKYNMSILGVVRTGKTRGRGDSLYLTWRLKDAPPGQSSTRAGVVDADAYWERITYFLERVVPVANEYQVKIACHPHDPGMPPQGYRGVDTVLGTVEGLEKFLSIQESPYHGLNFCQGTVSEMLADPGTQIFDVIRRFGKRGLALPHALKRRAAFTHRVKLVAVEDEDYETAWSYLSADVQSDLSLDEYRRAARDYGYWGTGSRRVLFDRYRLRDAAVAQDLRAVIVEAKRLGDLDELDHVDAALAAFIFGYEALRLAQAVGQLLLRHASLFAGGDQQLQQADMSG